EHGRRPHLRFAERHRGELERQAARLPYAALHVLRDRAQAGVARRELGPRVADADDRAAVEHVIGQSLALHPATMNEAVLVLAAVALRAPEPLFVFRGHFI